MPLKTLTMTPTDPLTVRPVQRHLVAHRSLRISLMILQRRLLHAMLALLALAALAGISTIFMPRGEFIGRVAATLALAAISIAIAIPVSRLLGVQADRTYGMVSLQAIVIGFCLGISAIWFDFIFNINGARLAFTTLAYALTTAAGFGFFALHLHTAGRFSGIAGMACSAVVFISWLLAIWGGRFGLRMPGEWAETSGLVIAAAVPLSASLYGTPRDGHPWRWLGTLAGAAGVGLGLIGIWIITGGKPTIIIHCYIMAAIIGGANVLVRLPVPKPQTWLCRATTGMLGVTGVLAMVVNAIGDENMFNQFENIYLRLLTAASIVTA